MSKIVSSGSEERGKRGARGIQDGARRVQDGLKMVQEDLRGV